MPRKKHSLTHNHTFNLSPIPSAPCIKPGSVTARGGRYCVATEWFPKKPYKREIHYRITQDGYVEQRLFYNDRFIGSWKAVHVGLNPQNKRLRVEPCVATGDDFLQIIRNTRNAARWRRNRARKRAPGQEDHYFQEPLEPDIHQKTSHKPSYIPQHVGTWTVLGRCEIYPQKIRCKCIGCGETHSVNAQNLKRGGTRSCGKQDCIELGKKIAHLELEGNAAWQKLSRQEANARNEIS